MVNFRLFDNTTRQEIATIDARSDLPDDVNLDVDGPLLVESNSYAMLSRILSGTPNKSIAKISITNHSFEESPEHLAFLVLLFNKTSCLELWYCLNGNSAFSCLMASLFSTDGIRELDISASMSIEQSKLFFAGVAASPCLQSLRIRCDMLPEYSQEIANDLIWAVRRNQSLQRLNVSSENFTHASFLPTLLKEVSQKKGIRTFCNDSSDDNDHLAVDAVQDALCHKECTLEGLDLIGIIPMSNSIVQVGCVIQNSSVKRLTLAFTSQINIVTAMKAVQLFSSLVKLDLSHNRISDLSALDSILLTNRSSLQCLLLSRNRIDALAMEAFAPKLPRMKSLRNLELHNNPFLDSSECCNTLKEAFWKNTHLEGFGPVLEQSNSTKWSDYVTALNRAGRGPLKSLAANPSLVVSLWPLILYRATTIKYYAWSDAWEEPTCTALRADAVFWILRETMTSVLR